MEPPVARPSDEVVAVEQTLGRALRELREKEEALRRSEAQLRDFVENAPLGLHRVGPDGTILWANREELDMLGYTQSEYVGRQIHEFHVDRHVIDDILARLSRYERLHNYEARLRAKDGSIRHVLISSNVYAPEGKFVHTRCFTRDITERRQSEEALRQNEKQLRLITDALPVLVSFVDRERRYQFVSAAYERWFGQAGRSLVGKHMEEVLGPQSYASIQRHVDQALSGVVTTFEEEISSVTGRRCVHGTYIPQRASDGSVSGFVGLVADITERRELERYRAAAAGRAERLLRVTGALADAITAEEVFEALVDRVAEAVEASSAALWLTDETGAGTARLARAHGYSQAAQSKLESLPLDVTPTIPALDAIRRGEPIFIASQASLLELYPHLRSIATTERPYRVACLPLMAHGRVLGSLGLTIDEAREASAEERDFLLLVARYATQSLERLRLFEAERQSRAEADAAANRVGVLSRASRAFAAAGLNLDSRVRGVASELAFALGSCINLALVESDGLLHTTAVHHPLPEAQEMLQRLAPAAPLRMGEGITGTIAATGEGVILPSIDPGVIAAHAPFSELAFLERFPAYAMIGAALRVQGRVIGTVTATRVRPGESYTAADLRLLEELADRAAVAIENSRLYQETVDARTRAEQLYRFAQAVMAADRLEVVFDAALSAIETALGAKRSAILTFDDKRVMRFRAWRNLSEHYRAAVEGHSPWSPDAIAPEPVLVPDPSGEPTMASYLPLFEQEGIGALAFIPLVTAGRLVGKFMIYYGEGHRFATHEVETARAIANHLASVTVRFAAVAKLEETIRYNEIFAGVLAHDLRNPLSAIMNAAQLVLMRREGEPGAAARDAKPLGRIIASGQRMTTMIDQLLDLTRARSGGGIQVQVCDTNLAELCAHAVGELETAHVDWNIRSEVVGDLAGTWDPERLLQVLSNLVANSGQHGIREAGIAIRLDGSHREHVTVEVHNKGAVPESLLPHLFDPFRSTQHRREQSRGLGLGLFIVREIVHAHGGTVQVSSSEAAGTTFLVHLPRHAARKTGERSAEAG